MPWRARGHASTHGRTDQDTGHCLDRSKRALTARLLGVIQAVSRRSSAARRPRQGTPARPWICKTPPDSRRLGDTLAECATRPTMRPSSLDGGGAASSPAPALPARTTRLRRSSCPAMTSAGSLVPEGTPPASLGPDRVGGTGPLLVVRRERDRSAATRRCLGSRRRRTRLASSPPGTAPLAGASTEPPRRQITAPEAGSRAWRTQGPVITAARPRPTASLVTPGLPSATQRPMSPRPRPGRPSARAAPRVPGPARRCRSRPGLTPVHRQRPMGRAQEAGGSRHGARRLPHSARQALALPLTA